MAQSDLTASDRQTLQKMLGSSDGVTAWEAYLKLNGPGRTGLTYGDIQNYMKAHATPMKRGPTILKRGRGMYKQKVYTLQSSFSA